MRIAVMTLAVACLLSGCGDGSSGRAPTQPTPVIPTVSEWTLAGRVTTTISGEPVAGATIAATDVTATTDGAGRFELKRPLAPVSPLEVTVSAGGYLSRETQVIHPRATPLVVDIIAERTPFDLSFYRALVRDGFESPGELKATHRWTRNAIFYLKTVDDTGRSLEPEVLARLQQEIPRAFSEWTSGRYRATLEIGAEDRPEVEGLVRVNFTRDPDFEHCALATVGGNYGWITFRLDYCGCGSLRIDPRTMWHEVGHTAGFWHVRGDFVMDKYFEGGCTAYPAITAPEQYHARVAYERPFGNIDPDQDPIWFHMLRAGEAPPVVTCGGRR
jgi:hypothetical protein